MYRSTSHSTTGVSPAEFLYYRKIRTKLPELDSNFNAVNMAWYGMEWKMEWNGTEISVWNMEDAGMEWKTIFHTSIPIPY